MDRIKSVKKAETIQCKDAVAKKALKAVLSRSHNASYRKIDVHSVKDAGVSEVHPDGTVYTGRGYNNVSAREAVVNNVHTDVPGYKNADYSLTIEELFSGTGRNL
ncbi:MAG: hypothetical protein OSJ45_14420 [Lachnospiraceae bacterium]|nr:hypothetical protein [Lachnospiraceae bacterium]